MCIHAAVKLMDLIMIGIEAAVALGAFGGKHELGMEVLEAVSAYDRETTKAFLADGKC